MIPKEKKRLLYLILIIIKLNNKSLNLLKNIAMKLKSRIIAKWIKISFNNLNLKKEIKIKLIKLQFKIKIIMKI